MIKSSNLLLAWQVVLVVPPGYPITDFQSVQKTGWLPAVVHFHLILDTEPGRAAPRRVVILTQQEWLRIGRRTIAATLCLCCPPGGAAPRHTTLCTLNCLSINDRIMRISKQHICLCLSNTTLRVMHHRVLPYTDTNLHAAHVISQTKGSVFDSLSSQMHFCNFHSGKSKRKVRRKAQYV